MVARFAHLLSERFNRPLSSFTAILDWGWRGLADPLSGRGRPGRDRYGSQPAHMQYCRTASCQQPTFVAMGDTSQRQSIWYWACRCRCT